MKKTYRKIIINDIEYHYTITHDSESYYLTVLKKKVVFKTIPFGSDIKIKPSLVRYFILNDVDYFEKDWIDEFYINNDRLKKLNRILEDE